MQEVHGGGGLRCSAHWLPWMVGVVSLRRQYEDISQIMKQLRFTFAKNHLFGHLCRIALMRQVKIGVLAVGRLGGAWDDVPRPFR